jgi:ABC-type glycerol-3-phosphate transport system substrate-binding protein
MKRPVVILASLSVAAIALSGCGTGGTANNASSEDPVSTELTDEEVVLTVAYASDPPITPLTEGFTELHPNVTFELVQTPFADYQTSLKLALAGDDAPDIVQYSPGPMRSIVPAGLVIPLDDYADAYGWDESVPSSLRGILSSNEDATQYGTGELYAIPGAIQMIGVFYNKALTEAAGVDEVPATLADFEDDLQAVQDSGVTPMAMPALGIGAFQLWGSLANVLADPAMFNSWVYGEPDATLEADPGFAEAAATAAEWSEAGYFPNGAAAIADADAIGSFTAGEQAYFVTGNWNTKVFQEALGDDLGFFLMPGETADAPAVATGSGFPYSISSNSEHKDVAAAFLDYMTSQEAAEGIYESGFIPVATDTGITSDDVRGELQADYESVVADDGVAPFANWATSSMLDTLTSGMQAVLSGDMSPEDFIASLQADWESNRP